MEFADSQRMSVASGDHSPHNESDRQALLCVLMGDESLLIECASALLNRGHIIQAIATESPVVARWASERDLVVLECGPHLESDLASLPYDWFFSITNLRMVPEAIWQEAAQGAVNFHDGPLPRYAGLNASTWALLNGEDTHGVAWHRMDKAADTGEILAQQSIEISVDETSFTLNAKCFEAGLASFSELLSAIENHIITGRSQDLTKRTYFRRSLRPTGAGVICFDEPSRHLEKLGRALDFGPGYDNPLVTAKLWTGKHLFVVTSMSVIDAETSLPVGSVLHVSEDALTVTCRDGAVEVRGLRDMQGRSVEPRSLFLIGERLPICSDVEKELKESCENASHGEKFFLARLARPHLPELTAVKVAKSGTPSRLQAKDVAVPKEVSADRCIAALLAALLRETGQHILDVAFTDDMMELNSPLIEALHAQSVPLRASLDQGATNAAFEQALTSELAVLHRLGRFASDALIRHPGINPQNLPVGIRLARPLSAPQALPGCRLTFVVPSATDGRPIICVFDEGWVDRADVESLVQRIEIAVTAFFAQPDGAADDLPLMSEDTRYKLMRRINRTRTDYPRDACIHHLIKQQMELSPDAVALVHGNEELTYRELDVRAERVASELRARGAGPEKLVGIHIGRSLDLVVGALGTLKAGAAYLPLDPSYPTERLRYMVEHSGVELILTHRSLLERSPVGNTTVLCMEDVSAEPGATENCDGAVSPSNLAYVIYTSGSTGHPKGVMIEHRNVVNFFAGMDERVPWSDLSQATWLAVTSLSFDIAVLELFWTLTRGFKVVIANPPRPVLNNRKDDLPQHSTFPQKMDFGLYFWGDDDGRGLAKYRLLLEAARFADANGFNAVWTPERHFHSFGGAFPNPAVTGAAVAAVTSNLSIRAGSCVLPLHHPARVAEEWAVVDNLTGGRVGIAFASGWMPEDFVLRPENAPPQNKVSLSRDIDVVRRLWRGDPVPFTEPGGKRLDVVTQPRPVQKELPVWLTTAGNPESYREAASLGANILTHLIGQSITELSGKIAIYRQTLRDSGRDPNAFKVTVMLHTFIGQDRGEVRERVREPMKAYLRSAVGLIKQYAWAFPAFSRPAGIEKPMDIDLLAIGAEDLDAILEFAFHRYFEDSGLFGTPADALRRVRQLQDVGVDEIACLIDFGLECDVALDALIPLAKVVAEFTQPFRQPTVDSIEDDLGTLIRRHAVTHLQCTPAMASMILAAPNDRAALASVRHLFIGGEALHGSIVAELGTATQATIENMYGPTETTVWSSTHRVTEAEGISPLGLPIANTRLYVLDPRLRPVPPGHIGELFIGGYGVARGYLNQPDLTAERFISSPFDASDRLYRTGDLVRFDDAFTLHYIARTDNQVKVRGFRIELYEIEARLLEYPCVKEAVAVVQENRPGDQRIVAYFTTGPNAVDAAQIRSHMARTLPDFMVPSHYIEVEHLPLTPNAKIDRSALPRLEQASSASIDAENFVAPANAMERAIADLFGRLLGRSRVGAEDNFFVLGGHSLLAVQAHRELKDSLAPSMSITDLFRFPTAASLAIHLGGAGSTSELARVSMRAQARRRGLPARADAAGPSAK